MQGSFNVKRDLLDDVQIARVIRRMAGEIVEQAGDLDHLMLVGIRTRGVPLAERLATVIEALEGTKPHIGILDITLYRDDLSTIAPQPVVKETRLGGSVDGKTVMLCDDVLYTGRTVRAALDALLDYGRPHVVRLAVLVDRGHRELPIQADIVGTQVQTTQDELVEVHFRETDEEEQVRLLERPGRGAGT